MYLLPQQANRQKAFYPIPTLLRPVRHPYIPRARTLVKGSLERLILPTDCESCLNALLPPTLRDVDGGTLNHGCDAEADIAALTGGRGWVALALLDRPGNAAANLKEGYVGCVRVQCRVWVSALDISDLSGAGIDRASQRSGGEGDSGKERCHSHYACRRGEGDVDSWLGDRE